MVKKHSYLDNETFPGVRNPQAAWIVSKERINLFSHSSFREVSQDGIRNIVIVLFTFQEMVAKTMMHLNLFVFVPQKYWFDSLETNYKRKQ